jgi:hypothetical protein
MGKLHPLPPMRTVTMLRHGGAEGDMKTLFEHAGGDEALRWAEEILETSRAEPATLRELLAREAAERAPPPLPPIPAERSRCLPRRVRTILPSRTSAHR